MEQQRENRSLVKKLAEIMLAVRYIEKKGYNKEQKYSYFQEADLLEAIREEFASRNIVIFPAITKQEVIPAGITKGGTPKFLTTIEMEISIEDGDSGEIRLVKSGGQGIDSGDKGVYKATTGAIKYGLIKLLQIPTGDDPEKDDHGGGQGQKTPQNQQQSNANKDPFARLERLGMELQYSFDHLMGLINATRQKNGSPPVAHFREMDPEWTKAIEQLLQKRLDKMRGGK